MAAKEIRQCPSCGGFCKKSGCERENVPPKAAQALGKDALWLIKTILLKHDAAIIEASQEAIEAAVLAEREACAREIDIPYFGEGGKECASAIRARSNT